MYSERADSSRRIEEITTDHFFNIPQQNQNGDDNDNQIQELARDIVFHRSTESSQSSSNESLNPIPREINIIDDNTDNELWLMALMITGMFIWIWNFETG